jgi:hypothetical protein
MALTQEKQAHEEDCERLTRERVSVNNNNLPTKCSVSLKMQPFSVRK